ncbi:hypothetical protein ACHQM5_021388 [Ranunculus cassubicifolius]
MKYTEYKHSSHEHILTLGNEKTQFKCDGCGEPGWGARYRCDDCNYDLHKECTLASKTMYHPFYKKRHFQLLEQGAQGRYCDACGRDVLGFVYHCYETGYDLHPCCASLPLVLQGGGVELHLRDTLSENCGKCRTKRLWGNVRGWSYRSSDKECHYHVSCVKDIFVEKWERGYFGEEGMNNLAIEIANVPNLQVARQNGRSSSRFNKCLKIAKLVLNLIISILTGDPVGLVTFCFQ